jgi:hypothetical protein
MLVPLVPWFQAITNWLFALFGRERRRATSASCAPGSRVIEFRVPENFQAQRRWGPPEVRGKVLEFSARRVRKSA